MTDDERNARIATLTDAVADTNRAVAALAEPQAVADHQLAALIDVAAEQGNRLGLLTQDVASLARLMRQHLVTDRGYPEIGDDDA